VQAAPSATQPPEPESHKDDSDGIFGPIRLGPLVGVGLPGVLTFGGILKLTRFFGAGINVGIIPTAQISFYGDATLAYQEYDVYGHIFPFGGGFFLGAGVGYMHAQGSLAETWDLSAFQIPPGLLPPGYMLPASLEYTSGGSVRAMVLTPQIGYLHTFGSGFSVGFDIGAQIPIAPSEISVESSVKPQELAQLPEFQQTEQAVRDTLEKVGATPLPTINFRIGWLL